MSLTSNLFILFVFITVVLYYILPHKTQWLVLLAASYVYYIYSGPRYVYFILFSTLCSYLCGRLIEKFAENKDENGKTGNKKLQKAILICGLILNFGMLGIIKYTNFVVENLNALFHMELRGIEILLPLGISFYTFQTAGYLLDVYWKRVKAEKNVFRYALFVSFFPQILQGPIGRFGRLANQLYAEHSFSGKRILHGCERILWGFFKKMVLADWAAVFVDAIFGVPDQYSGLAIFGVLFYTIQLYADFSGGMDVVIGVASLFGVEMDENFKRPFFAVSITDFWHRWHITLGTWMKDYVFYPISLSGWMGAFGKLMKKIFGRKKGRVIPICLANLIVFFVVGVWHGAEWRYIVYGIYNGLIIAFSGLMADTYRTWKKKLHINDKAVWYHIFCVVRTFLLVNISWFFDRAESVGDAFRMMGYAVTQFDPSQLLTITTGAGGTVQTITVLCILGAGCLVLFVVGLLQERGISIRERIAAWPPAFHFAIYLGLLLAVGFLGSTASVRGFIYAQF